VQQIFPKYRLINILGQPNSRSFGLNSGFFKRGEMYDSQNEAYKKIIKKDS
jgi:hypothetical protein